tara:strand:- start:1361 stop:1912 length:552 start_codon:yes stop_codon:yes gene_type:complete
VIQFSKLTGGNFTKIPNELLNDEKLSFKAKGLFCHMASKPNKWVFTAGRLAKQFNDGTSAIYAALDELKKRGWVSYIKSADGTGQYLLVTTLNPNFSKQSLGKPKEDKKLKPKAEKPKQGIPIMGKSKPISNKEVISNKDIYKGDYKSGALILEGIDGDKFGSSTKYTQSQIMEMAITGVINV